MKFSTLKGTVSSLLTNAYTCITHSLVMLSISVIPEESCAPSQSISSPHPLPKQPLIQFLVPEINFAYSRTLYKLNHTEYIFVSDLKFLRFIHGVYTNDPFLFTFEEYSIPLYTCRMCPAIYIHSPTNGHQAVCRVFLAISTGAALSISVYSF